MIHPSIQHYFLQLDTLSSSIDLYIYERSFPFFTIRSMILLYFCSTLHKESVTEIYTIIESKDFFWKENKNMDCSFLLIEDLYKYQKKYKRIFYGDTIIDFDSSYYKEYYQLPIEKEKDLWTHFIEIGQFQGMKPNGQFPVLLPVSYRRKLHDMNLLYFWDLPDDFDIYYYHQHNSDLKHLSIVDTLFHYLHHGFLEGRSYCPQSHTLFYLNHFYLTILERITYIEDIKKIHFIYDFSNVNLYIYIQKRIQSNF